MEIYTTENEQVDAIRNFLSENGKALAVGVVLSIGAVVGWRYWQNHQKTTAMAASDAYEQTTTTLNTENIAATEKFIQANGNNYAVFAALHLATYLANEGDFVKAEQQLLAVRGQAKDENLFALVNLRLARIQLQQQKLDDALKTLDTVQGTAGWEAMMQDARGDILLAKGDHNGAREAYVKGISASNSSTISAIMRMKLNNLPS